MSAQQISPGDDMSLASLRRAAGKCRTHKDTLASQRHLAETLAEITEQPRTAG
jgi:hypothetical protein